MGDETTLGYVVIERNQASGWPSILDFPTLYDTEEEAAESAAREQADNRRSGRRERYSIARVIEINDV